MFFRDLVMQGTAMVSIGLLTTTGMMAAQAQDPSYPPPPPQQQQQQYPAQGNTAPWTPVGQDANGNGQQAPQQNPYPASNGQGPYNQAPNGQPPYNQPSYNQAPYQQGPQQPMAPVPAQLTIAPGTFLTVRVNQVLSSDHNQQGDAFSASLVQPLVVNGVVVAEPGQTIEGRVVEAQKAGRVEGTARLAVQLTELTLVDGQQLPLRSQFVSRRAGTSVGRDAGAIATTTGLGAAIGAAAGWGTGAAIGAGAGAVAGTIGVLLTRGHASVIGPEQILTFRIEAPVSIDTTRSVQAFRYVQPNEYDRPVYNQPASYGTYSAQVPVAAPYYGAGYGYPYYYPYSYGYGPGFSLFFGSGYYGRGYYGRGGFYGRGYGYGGGFRHR